MLTGLAQSVAISRRVIQYDTRPLVTWNEITPTATPDRKPEPTPIQSTGNISAPNFSNTNLGQTPQRFPLEKLAMYRLSPEKESAIPTPPPEVDDMDWTPSGPTVQHEIRPTISVHERDKKSVLDGPLPFYGSLPAAPKPPAWNLRSQPVKSKPIEQVVERNPFHRTPTQPPRPWERNPGRPDPVFAPPKFFPTSDHSSSTGLESLFNQAFTIKTPEDEGKEDWQQHQQQHQQQRQQAPQNNGRQPIDVQGIFVFQYLRLGLLLASLLAWTLSQNGVLSVPGNYVEVASLGSASLLAGFALLDVLKQPIVYWNGMEILVYFAELAAAVHLGGNLPRVSYEREYFDRYGRLLLVFMAAQEALGLLSLYRAIFAHAAHAREQPTNQQMNPSNKGTLNSPSIGHENSLVSSTSQPQNSLSVPPLSFSSTAAGSSFSTQSPEQHYQLPPQSTFGGQQGLFDNNNNHSFTLGSLKDNESEVDPFEHDSDTETTMTATTNATNATIRNIRYGGSASSNDFYSPRRADVGSGLGGLSLDDNKPARRMTRSQTKQRMGGLGGDPYSRRYSTRR